MHLPSIHLSRKSWILSMLAVVATLVIVIAGIFLSILGHKTRNNTASNHTTSSKQVASPTATPKLISSSIYVPLSNGSIESLDGKNGNKQWSRSFALASHIPFEIAPLDFSTTTSLISQDNILYMDAPAITSPNLVALDKQDGHSLWTFNRGYPCAVQGPALSFYTALSSGNFYVISGGDNISDCAYANHKVTALDAKTGKQLWNIDGVDLVGTADGIAFVYNFQTFKALNSINGSVMWSIPIDPNNIISGLKYTSTTVYAVFPNRIQAYSLKTGTLLWSYGYSNVEVHLQVTLNDSVFALAFGAGSDNIHFLKLTNGHLQWQIAGSTSGSAVDSSLFVSGTHLYRRSVQPLTFAEVDVTNGSIIWTSSNYGNLIDNRDEKQDDQIIYISPYDCCTLQSSNLPQEVSALKLGSNNPLWKTNIQGKIAHVSVGQGVVAVSTFEHNVVSQTPSPGTSGASTDSVTHIGPFYVYLLNATDGSIIWKYQTTDMSSNLMIS
jgi:outer membrane protein assembly factor BamB